MSPLPPIAGDMSLISSLTDRTQASLGLLALSPAPQCSHFFPSGKEHGAAAFLLRVVQSLWLLVPPWSSEVVLLLSGWLHFISRVLCQLAGRASGTLSSLSFACFLYSLTRSAGGLSCINVLFPALRSLDWAPLGKFPFLLPSGCSRLGLERSFPFPETWCRLSSSFQLAEAQCSSLGCQHSS